MCNMSPNMMLVCRIGGVEHAAAAHTEPADTFLLPVHSCSFGFQSNVCSAEVLFALHHRLRLQFEGAHQHAYHLPYT